MLEINSTNYPKLFILLDEIVYDSGMDHAAGESYFVEDEYDLGHFESKIHHLSEEELSTLASGEETEMLSLVEKYDLQDVHDFLNVFFEG
jgi:hypothetical protein